MTVASGGSSPQLTPSYTTRWDSTLASCSGATSCASAGAHSQFSTTTQWVLEVESGGTWTASDAPVPASANANPDDVYLFSLSCGGPNSCVATGAYVDTAGHSQGVLDILSGGTTPKTSTSSTTPPTSLPTNCPIYVFIGARGSGEAWSSENFGMGQLNDAVFTFLERHLSSMASTPRGVQSPAVSLVDGWDVALTAVTIGGATFGVGKGLVGAYKESVNDGVQWLTGHLETYQYSAGCRATRFILSGYSQGAQVVADSVASLPATYRHLIAGVLLFGDPQFNGQNEPSDRSTYDTDRYGALSSTDGTRKFPNWLSGHVWSYCHQNDPICQLDIRHGTEFLPSPTEVMIRNALSGVPLKDILKEHTNYDNSEDVSHAASDLGESLMP